VFLETPAHHFQSEVWKFWDGRYAQYFDFPADTPFPCPPGRSAAGEQPYRIGMGIMPASVAHILFFYLAFTLVDVAAAALAFSFEKEDYSKLLWMIPQRLVYRQLMYYILIKSVSSAVRGELQGWGVLKRTGSVKQLVA
jgi:hypothetical protein